MEWRLVSVSAGTCGSCLAAVDWFVAEAAEDCRVFTGVAGEFLFEHLLEVSRVHVPHGWQHCGVVGVWPRCVSGQGFSPRLLRIVWLL